jgi:RNA polymerase sigma-70 factor, ECF subfamily
MASDAFVRILRWSRPLRRSGPIADRSFQGPDDPFPGHWRDGPEPWQPAPRMEQAVQRRLRTALDEMPATWRAVVVGHDVDGRPDAEIASELGITLQQERSVLMRARAALRDRLVEGSAGDRDR